MTARDAVYMIDRGRVSSRRRIEECRNLGLAGYDDGPPDALLDAVMIAMFTGLSSGSWVCVAEAYVMAANLYRMMTGRESDFDRHVQEGGPDQEW
jgi:hypothetical protein